jgi:hypothetical protein
MSLEMWKSIFEYGGVALLFLTFVFGGGLVITTKRINERQAEALRQFEKELAVQQERAAKAERDAADAKAIAAKASDQTLTLESNAANAKERAAKAEKALLELQQKLSDRTLSEQQLKTIAARLKAFSGQEYQVIAYWDSKESMAIGNRIHEALQLAHWVYLKPDGWHGLLGGAIGVVAYIHPDADEYTRNAAVSLISALNSEGIESELKHQIAGNNPKNNKISLTIGAKR